MGLKDDFLEALRSVKRDFMREYDPSQSPAGDTEPDGPQQQASQFQQPPSPPAGAVPPAPEEPRESASFADALDEFRDTPAQDAAELFGGTAPRDEPAVHSGDDSELIGDDLEPDVDPTPYRTADAGKMADEILASIHSDSQDETLLNGVRRTFDGGDGPENVSDEKTIISRNTVIRGALQTEDSVRMFGQVLGDIDCKSNILVAGKVRGNTSAANAYVIDAQVDGNLMCDDVVNVTDDAWILGNIRAQQAEIDGKIKGNIEIRHTISIGSNSSVIGNISTDELEIKRGAFINGQIMMYSPSRDVIDRFDQFDQ